MHCGLKWAIFSKNRESMEQLIQAAKERRRQLGLTLRDVADLSGLGINQISRFECGQGGISLRNLLRLMEILGLRLYAEPARKPEPGI